MDWDGKAFATGLPVMQAGRCISSGTWSKSERQPFERRRRTGAVSLMRAESPVSSGACLAFGTMNACDTPDADYEWTGRRPPRSSPEAFVRIAILVVILGTASLVAWQLGYFKLLGSGGLGRLMGRLHRVPWIGPWYVVGFAMVAALGIPLTPLVLLAGALFGFSEGFVVAWTGLILGTSGAYWIADSSAAGR